MSAPITRRALTLGVASAALEGCGEANSVQAVLDAYVTAGRIAGASCIIERGGRRELAASGRLSLAPDAPLFDERSICRIYSMTKPLTAVAVLQLIDSGQLGLDAALAEVLPAFEHPTVLLEDGRVRPARRAITIRHLLTHTAGLGYAIFDDHPLTPLYRREGLEAGGPERSSDASKPQSLLVFGDRLARLPLASDPGEAWSYSVAFDLLGLVVETVCGQPFSDVLEQRVLAPLQMQDTAFWVPQAKRARFASCYDVRPNGLELEDGSQTSAFNDLPPIAYGGAGLVSTAADYARFCAMLLNSGSVDGEEVLSAQANALLRADLLPRSIGGVQDVGGNGFGAGVYVVTSPRGYGPEPMGSFGWGGAAGTSFWVDPQNAMSGVLMVQYMPFTAYALDAELKEAAYRQIR